MALISINISAAVSTIEAKKSIIKDNLKEYKKASKKVKTDMLDDLEKTLHWHRK